MEETVLVIKFLVRGQVVAKTTIVAERAMETKNTDDSGHPGYVCASESRDIEWIHDRSQIDGHSPIQVMCGYTDELPSILLLEETDYRIKVERLSPGLDNTQEFSFLRGSGESLKSTRDFDKEGSDQVCYYFFRSRSYVGKSFLNVVHEGEEVSIPIEIRSKKLGYLQDYPLMLEEIAEYYMSVLFQFDSPVFTDVSVSSDISRFPYEDFMVLEYIFDKMDLPGNFAFISRNRCSELRIMRTLVPAGAVSELDVDGLMMSLSSGSFSMDGDRIQFHHAYATEYYEDEDTPENRLVKALLTAVVDLSSRLKRIADQDSRRFRGTYMYDKLVSIEQDAQNMLAEDWMSNVGDLTHIPSESSVLQKKHGYRELFIAFQMLGMGTTLSNSMFSELLEGHNKRVYQIYEYWCYIKLYAALSMMSTDQTHKRLKVTGNGFDLSPKAHSGTSFDILVDGVLVNVELYYNREFKHGYGWDSSYSLTVRPDYTLVIMIETSKGIERHLLNFDAKYKVKKLDEHLMKDEEIDTDCWAYDIYKMHTYRDALLRSSGSYVFYPGNNP